MLIFSIFSIILSCFLDFYDIFEVARLILLFLSDLICDIALISNSDNSFLTTGKGSAFTIYGALYGSGSCSTEDSLLTSSMSSRVPSSAFKRIIGDPKLICFVSRFGLFDFACFFSLSLLLADKGESSPDLASERGDSFVESLYRGFLNFTRSLDRDERGYTPAL